jgi:hypothetical protein
MRNRKLLLSFNFSLEPDMLDSVNWYMGFMMLGRLKYLQFSH